MNPPRHAATQLQVLMALCLMVACQAGPAPSPDEVAGTGTAGGNPSTTVGFALVTDDQPAGVDWSRAAIDASSVAFGRRSSDGCVLGDAVETAGGFTFGSSEIIADVDLASLCAIRFNAADDEPIVRLSGQLDAEPIEARFYLEGGVDIVVSPTATPSNVGAPAPRLVVALNPARLLLSIARDEIPRRPGVLDLDDRDADIGDRLRVNLIAALSVLLDPTPNSPLTLADRRGADRVGYATPEHPEANRRGR